MAFVLAALALTASAPTSQTAADRVRAADRAQDTLNYSAKVKTSRFGSGDMLATEATVYQQGRRVRIVYSSFNLKGRMVISDGQSVYQLDAAAKRLVRADATSEPKRLEMLLKNYRTSFAGHADVAGRPCDIVVVKSPHAGMPFKKLWIDQDTGLILRNEAYDSSGTLRSLTVFESVALNPSLPAKLFRPPDGWSVETAASGGEKHYSREAISRLVNFSVLTPSYLPSGFVLDGVHLCHCREGVPYVLARYVDGLDSISVIERFIVCPVCGKTMGPPGGGRRWRGGRGQATCDLPMLDSPDSAVVDRGKIRVMVMGDLPMLELRHIADSIH